MGNCAECRRRQFSKRNCAPYNCQSKDVYIVKIPIIIFSSLFATVSYFDFIPAGYFQDSVRPPRTTYMTAFTRSLIHSVDLNGLSSTCFLTDTTRVALPNDDRLKAPGHASLSITVTSPVDTYMCVVLSLIQTKQGASISSGCREAR